MIALYILVGLLAVFVLLLYLIYRRTFYASRRQRLSANPYELPFGAGECNEKMRELITAVKDRPYERVTVIARDGTLLSARYHHVADGAPLEIQCHGYRGVSVREFCGGNRLAAELGHNTLLIDQRAHGESGGHTITFGIRERYDILDWIGYARRRFGDVPILLVGVSMGGASVLMASGEQLPECVVGVVADCPYSSPRDIICSVLRTMQLPPAVAYPMVSAAARVFGRFSLAECTALDAVLRARVPILILHGEADTLVPCDMSRAIAAASDLVTLVTFPGAEHGMSFMSDPDRYQRAVIDFCRNILD